MSRKLIASVIFLTLIFLASLAKTLYCDPADNSWESQAFRLVEGLKRDGIADQAVLEALLAVPRHAFVPSGMRRQAYADHPLPIGHEQTISQPFVVAYMCQALKLTGKEKVLEIGTGSGYHAAVLSLLVDTVYTIEIIPELGRRAARTLDSLSYDNIIVKIGDGYRGLPDNAPFDAIILTAAPPEIPQPLLDQMKIGARLIAPVGETWQKLVLIERTDEGYSEKPLLPVRFVPMTGEAQERK
ncbi:MAG: protein-L-isoaspartate(D-aspartate) O-methyltransferase [Calditrichaeota bacterium]|nr:protein-L-isoaspartate(D-aspartate) O-methyltransferase [Calditrichota bacterium]